MASRTAMRQFDPMEQFGSKEFPIESVLGPQTRRVIENADHGEAFIIQPRQKWTGRCGLSGYAILAEGPRMSEDQLAMIRQTIFEPRAYYAGRPLFRRLPPAPDFAIQLHAGDESLDLMLDLHNPGWGFYCGGEAYEAWNWVGPTFVQLAKDVFPALASKDTRFVWQKGAIERLVAAKRDR